MFITFVKMSIENIKIQEIFGALYEKLGNHIHLMYISSTNIIIMAKLVNPRKINELISIMLKDTEYQFEKTLYNCFGIKVIENGTEMTLANVIIIY